MSLRMFLLAPAILLAACGADDNDPGVGGVTVGEARALNEAAAMLDNQTAAQGVVSDPTVPAAENASR